MSMRPILFSPGMVVAILNGHKSVTRRIINEAARVGYPSYNIEAATSDGFTTTDGLSFSWTCPFGAPGDTLWIREEHYRCGHWEPVLGGVTRRGRRQKWRFVPDSEEVLYTAPAEYLKGRHTKTPGRTAWYKRLARFMPRSCSRLTLEVTGVGVGRVQSITEEQALAEGVRATTMEEYWTAYDPLTDGYPSYSVEPDAERIAQRGLENVRHHGPKVIQSARDAFRMLWISLHGLESWEADPWAWAVSFRVVATSPASVR